LIKGLVVAPPECAIRQIKFPEPSMTLKITALALAGLMSVTAVATVFADAPMTAEQAVMARTALMKQDGKALKGAAAFTGAKAIAALTTVQTNYGKLPALFIKDSITGKSIALPIIWKQFDQFSAIFAKGAAAATDGIAAVKAGDMTKYKADLKLVASTCMECHKVYRAKDDD
jgi:cytochrome c556